MTAMELTRHPRAGHPFPMRCTHNAATTRCEKRPGPGAPRSGCRKPPHERGASLLEAVVAMNIAATAMLAAATGLGPLLEATRLEAARSVVVEALREARRTAYATGEPAAVAVAVGSGAVVVLPGARTRELGRGVTIASAPSDGRVDFFATGLADNATVVLTSGNATASVVVNQRGVIR
jgi:Tfp pilus assembly protein FimT